MQNVFVSLGRAVVSQLHVRMLLLTLVPFAVSVVVWGIVLWLTLQPLIDALHGWFSRYDAFRQARGVLQAIGADTLTAVLVPHIAMWMLLPLMILSSLVFVGVFAMPAVTRHVAQRHYPELERKRGGSVAGSVWVALSSFALFVVLWIATLPLMLLPPVAFLVHPLLWGWLTYRVMSYDALADHASIEERHALVSRHRWPLLAIGTVAGALGAVPAVLWLGGVLAVIFFPLVAAISIWLYLLVFVFSGLWFQHYCLDALAAMRRTPLPQTL